MKTASKIVWVIFDSIFLIIFNFVFFIVTSNTDWFPDGRIDTTWLNYGCVHFAYLLLLLSPLFTPRNVAKDTMPSTVVTVLRFWWVELIVACVLIAWQIPFLYNICVQMVLIAWFVARICIIALANMDTAQKVERHEKELQYVKIAEAQLRFLLSSISEKKTSKTVETLYDYIRTSPLRSNVDVYALEQQILERVSLLTSLKTNEQIVAVANETLILAKQRNQQLLIFNKSL